jgi:hypothetical protein
MLAQAYEYFFEEEEPQDFLAGTALELAFLNFEDWFVCDCSEEGASVLALYVRESGADPKAFRPLEESVISLYEVKALGSQGVLLQDLLLGGEYLLPAPQLQGLRKGDLFAARLLRLPEGLCLGGCLYPFRAPLREEVLGYVEKSFQRYRRNKRPGADMREFLKEEAYLFNVIWLSLLSGR